MVSFVASLYTFDVTSSPRPLFCDQASQLSFMTKLFNGLHTRQVSFVKMVIKAVHLRQFLWWLLNST